MNWNFDSLHLIIRNDSDLQMGPFFFYIRPLPHQLTHSSCQQGQGEHVRRPYLRSHSTTLYIMVYDRALQMCPV